MSSNDLRTALLLGGLTGLMLWVGQSLGGTQGLTIALVGAAVVNIGSFWFSDKIVLGMYRVRPLSDTEAPEVLRIVRELSQLNPPSLRPSRASSCGWRPWRDGDSCSVGPPETIVRAGEPAPSGCLP
jgi:hypothetical protein